MATNVSAGRDNTTDSSDRERMLSMVAGALGILMFLNGFLRWLEVGDDETAQKYSGYALQMPTTAIIGFSVAAGLTALFGATERRRGRGVPSALPLGLAVTSLLLAIGVWLGKGQISPELGAEVGVKIGLIVALIIALLQTVVLAMEMGSRRDEDHTDARYRTR